jgi:hypothetical protein
MPLIRRLRRLGLGGQLMLAAFLLLFLSAGVLLGATGWVHSNSIGACVNRNLGARQQSFLDFLRTTKAYSGQQDQYLQTVLTLHDRAEQRAALIRIEQRNRAWYAGVSAALAAAEKHPYGRC